MMRIAAEVSEENRNYALRGWFKGQADTSKGFGFIECPELRALFGKDTYVKKDVIGAVKPGWVSFNVKLTRDMKEAALQPMATHMENCAEAWTPVPNDLTETREAPIVANPNLPATWGMPSAMNPMMPPAMNPMMLMPMMAMMGQLKGSMKGAMEGAMKGAKAQGCGATKGAMALPGGCGAMPAMGSKGSIHTATSLSPPSQGKGEWVPVIQSADDTAPGQLLGVEVFTKGTPTKRPADLMDGFNLAAKAPKTLTWSTSTRKDRSLEAAQGYNSMSLAAQKAVVQYFSAEDQYHAELGAANLVLEQLIWMG